MLWSLFRLRLDLSRDDPSLTNIMIFVRMVGFYTVIYFIIIIIF